MNPISRKLLAGVVLTGATVLGTAQASTVWLTQPGAPVAVGDQVSLELRMFFDPADPTAGGVVDIAYKGFTNGTGLGFVSYTPYLGNPDNGAYGNVGDPVLGDPALTSAPTFDPNGVTGKMADTPSSTGTGLFQIAVGDWNGLSGDLLIGTLVFNALAVGSYTLMPSTSAAGDAFWTSISGAPQYPDYTNGAATVTVAPSAVPLPAAAWLMVSGLIALGGVGARRRRALA